MSFCFCLSDGKWITVAGLIFDLAGVGLLTISGIFGENPLRTLIGAYLKKDEVSEDRESRDIIDTSKFGVEHFSVDDIETPEERNRVIWRMGKLIFGLIFILLGFVLQIIGTAIS